MSAELSVEREGEVCTLTLNRPDQRNALSATLVEALLQALDAAHRDHLPVIVFRGAGRNFSAGFDFAGLDAQSEGDLLLRFVRIEQLLQAVAASPAVTLALAHGRNFGAGVDLVAACRLRVAAPEARFRMPGLKFGLVLGSRRFADLVGREAARTVLQHAETFDAGRALSLGFCHRLAEPADWHEVVAGARRTASVLDAETRLALHQALDGGRPDADLAALVRSAARPGLKQRVRQYLAEARVSGP